ncbi:hypothetical protein AOLI_G00290300 [Acnodon oligacanthus]
MVGKIKRARQKLHHGAVRAEAQAEGAPVIKPATRPDPLPARPAEKTPDLKAFNFPKGIFAGTRITPEALVQTLKFDEPSPVRTTKQAAEEQKGREEKKQQSKKEKMKERRQRWLNKISAIKVAREQQVARERRKATPVVGDMRVLADALPELTQLLPSVRESTTASAQRRNKESGAHTSSSNPHQIWSVQFNPDQLTKSCGSSKLLLSSCFDAQLISSIASRSVINTTGPRDPLSSRRSDWTPA